MGKFYKGEVLVVINHLNNLKKTRAKFKIEFNQAKNKQKNTIIRNIFQRPLRQEIKLYY